MPYNKIYDSKNYLNEYLNNFFDALVILFKKYDIPEDAIRSIELQVKKEVINNDEYNYNE